MNKYLLSIPAALLSFSTIAAPTQDVTLYGQLFNGTGDYSIYKFSSGTAAGKEQVKEIVAEPNCGAVKAGDRFYVFSAEDGDYGKEYAAYVYDASSDFQLITRIGSAYDMAKSNQVLAHDPVSGKIYTIYQESSGYYGSESYLGILDVSSRKITKVGYSLYFGSGSTHVVAMAFSPDGELFAIASNGRLYKVNTSTADLTSVGYLPITPEYVQSMAFSADGSTIYWAACNDYTNALYTIDPATGDGNKVKDFTNEEEFVTLWVGDIEAADDAPAAPTDLAAVFTGGSLTGQFKFTAPTKTHGGSDLTGTISYEITANGTTAGSGTATPGEKVSCPVTVAASGMYDFKVSVSNEAGVGENAALNGVFVGLDTPRGVENLRLGHGASDNEFIVTWDAPTTGAHGGYVDLSAIKYRVRRLPEFDVVSENATSPFTDTYSPEQPTKLSYEVTPYIDENTKGLALSTNSIMTGKPFETPWSEDFSSSSCAQLWTVADANDDGHSWEYQWDFGYYRIYDNENAKDDWLISPFIKMEYGYDYLLTFDVRTIATEVFEVKMGAGLDPEDMKYTISEQESVPDTEYSWIKKECKFSCTESGNMHIGFHAMTADPTNALALYIDNVKLEKTGLSGIKDAAANGNGAITADNNGVYATTDTAVDVFTPDGRKVASSALAAGDTMHLPCGLYIVIASDGTCLKAYIQ